MEKLREFLAMGGYAAYVWPAFGVALGVLAVIAWLSYRTLRRYEIELARLERDSGSPMPGGTGRDT